MGLGLADEANLTEEVIAGVREPFGDDDSRRALAAAGIGLRVEGFAEIERLLPSLQMPGADHLRRARPDPARRRRRRWRG